MLAASQNKKGEQDGQAKGRNYWCKHLLSFLKWWEGIMHIICHLSVSAVLTWKLACPNCHIAMID
jgi:hypothetical protein